MSMNRMHVLIQLLLVGVLMSAPVYARAVSEVRLDTNKIKTEVNEQFIVSVHVHTTTRLNAIEGTIVFPAELSLLSIRDGDSAISMWVERPLERTPGRVSFSGITPGGFEGAHNLLFALVFSARSEGEIPIFLHDVRALMHDGIGTEESMQINALSIAVETGDDVSRVERFVDTVPPEIFVPEIGYDASLFDGKLFLSFAAQDKGAGIDHYEVREGNWGWFSVAESPHLLKHQSRSHAVYVRAVDKAGNERTVMVSALSDDELCTFVRPACVFVHIPKWEHAQLLSILGIAALCVLLYRVWQKYTRR